MSTSKTSMLRRSIFWLCVLIAVVGLTYHYDKTLISDGWDSIATSMQKKELPIYCVKTDKPQVAISFDAAWGDGKLR